MARSKAATEAKIAELQARRGQIILNGILEGVIAAGLSATCGGSDDGRF